MHHAHKYTLYTYMNTHHAHTHTHTRRSNVSEISVLEVTPNGAAGRHAHIHTYIHIYIYTNVHTYMHTYMHRKNAGEISEPEVARNSAAEDTHTHSLTYTRTNTYTHTRIHAYRKNAGEISVLELSRSGAAERLGMRVSARVCACAYMSIQEYIRTRLHTCVYVHACILLL
jgi:hypothetical protein